MIEKWDTTRQEILSSFSPADSFMLGQQALISVVVL